MLKVLLVDDEPFILRGLSVLIDWEKAGFTVAGMAANSREALDFLKQEDVDLIIADIKMPGMSGLDMLEKIRQEQLSKAYFAILSGYQDFEFARRAIGNACVDYILKPVQRGELLNLLKRVSDMHSASEQRRMEEFRKEKEFFARNLISLIYGKYDNKNLEYIRERMCLEGGLRYIAVEIEDEAAAPQNRSSSEGVENTKRSMQRQLYEVCQDILSAYPYHCIMDVFRSENRYDVAIIYAGRMAKEAGCTEQAYLDRLLKRIQEQLGVPVTMLVGSRVGDVTQLGESFRTAAVAKSFQEFGQKNGGKPQARETGGSVLLKEQMDALARAIEENQKEKIPGCVDAVYEKIHENSLDADMVNVNVNYLLVQLIHLAVQQDENVNQEEILHFISVNAFHEKTMRGSRAHLISFSGEYAEYLSQLRSRTVRGTLGDIEKEIRENYAQNLTLKELSRKYYVNSAYLGQIFRKKYGTSFKDYLNAYRVERAAELLLHSNMKIYEIAERVGYHDLDYFINKFIDMKGCTPSKYRRDNF